MKKITIAITLISVAVLAHSQNILKKNEVSKVLPQIINFIENGNFEEALNTFYDKNKIILKENVKKNDLSQFEKIESVLVVKQSLFSQSDSTLKYFLNLYNNGFKCEATELLNYKFSNENAFKQTIVEYNHQKVKLIKIKHECDSIYNKLLEFRSFYDNGEYEKAFDIFLLDNDKYNHNRENINLYKQNMSTYDSLYDAIRTLYNQYYIFDSTYVVAPYNLISTLNVTDLSYQETQETIRYFDTITSNAITIAKSMYLQCPQLNERIQFVIKKVEEINMQLYKRLEEAKTYTNEEIRYKVIMGDSLSLEFIQSRCNRIKDNEPFTINNLDVFNYFSDIDAETDLQRHVYAESKEYIDKLNTLKILREDYLKRIHYYIYNLNDNDYYNIDNFWKYDVNSKGFSLRIKAEYYNDPFSNDINYENRPRTIGNVYFKQLDWIEDKFMGDSYFMIKDKGVFLPIEPKNAVNIERNYEDVKIMFVFEIDSFEEIKYQYEDYYGENKIFLKEYIVSKFVRVIIYNKITNEIYFNKIYN